MIIYAPRVQGGEVATSESTSEGTSAERAEPGGGTRVFRGKIVSRTRNSNFTWNED